MLTLSLKIWAVANLLVFLVVGFLSLSHGIVFAASALLYSAVFSLPAVPLLYGVLKFLRFVREGVLFSWTVLLLSTAVLAFSSYRLFSLVFHAADNDLDLVLPLSFVSAFSAVVFFSAPLHYLFQTFQYGNHENN